MTISLETLKRVVEFGHELDRESDLPEIEKVAGLYPRGFLSIFAAQAGTGKTWFMQYIACRLSCGGNILAGLVPKSKKYRSVIFAGETGKYLLDKRLRATCWKYDKSRIKIYDAIELQREEIPIMLNTPEGRATTIAILAHEKPDIIFYDTLLSFHSADESKQGEMTSIYQFLLKTAREFNCAIVLNHHTRKRSTKQQVNSLYTQDDVIGSSAGVRLASNVYIAQQRADQTTDDEGMPTIWVRDVKQWDKRTPEFSYRFIVDEATGLLDFAIEWGMTSQSAEWSLRERVEKFVAEHDAGAILRLDDVASNLVASKDSVRKYLDELTRKHKVERQKLLNATVWRVL